MVEGLTSSATDQGSVAGSIGIHRAHRRATKCTRARSKARLATERTSSRPQNFLVTLAERPHPFPSRTRKLSSPAPKILRGQPFGNIGRRQDFCVFRGVWLRARAGRPRRPTHGADFGRMSPPDARRPAQGPKSSGHRSNGPTTRLSVRCEAPQPGESVSRAPSQAPAQAPAQAPDPTRRPPADASKAILRSMTRTDRPADESRNAPKRRPRRPSRPQT